MLDELSWEPIINEIADRYKFQFEQNINFTVNSELSDQNNRLPKALRHILDNWFKMLKYSPNGVKCHN